jgi:hypothetical protein
MFGYEIGPPPAKVDGTGVLARLVDGLAFRYYWATNGLRPEDYAFRPTPESMSMLELQQHMLHLALMIKQTMFDADARASSSSDDPTELRMLVLENLALVREHLDELTDDAIAGHHVLRRDGRRYPVWHIINGPLADALTHVGQINTLRRLSGNPTPRVDVFTGTPPELKA